MTEQPPETNGNAITTRSLTKQFGDELAVRDLTLSVPAGKIFGFIGPSGCGKTTTVRLMTGIHKPTAGEVQVLGVDPLRFTEKIRRQLGYMPQLFSLYPEMTVRENLNFAASMYGLGLFRRKRLNKMLAFVELSGHGHRLVRELSGGMVRRLSLATTLIHEPQLIFLDEPTAGSDPTLRRKFWDYFKTLRDMGRTLVVTTQYVGEAAHCDYVGVLAAGRLFIVDTPRGLRSRAFGGEIVDLRSSGRIDFAMLQSLQDLPFITGSVTRLDPNRVRIVVKEVSTAIPDLMEWARQHRIPVQSVEPYLPPYDDVFVELLKDEDSNG